MLQEAKKALDRVIIKSRIHLYKPIQIAEILYRDRVFGDIDLLNLETYRTKSKAWRDKICIVLLGRISTSSAKFQDDLFNAIPPHLIAAMGAYNREQNGIVEAYIYRQFVEKYAQLRNALNYCANTTKENFCVQYFLDLFWHEAGLRRSIDKVYEIITHSLFDTLAQALELQITLSINKDKADILHEFQDFTYAVMNLSQDMLHTTKQARVYRVGVTNAADRGLDMYANWGIAIQIKHLSLDITLAQEIISHIHSDKIVIVCKDAEKDVIYSLLAQIGWNDRIQSIITENDLIAWYEKAMRGQYANLLGDTLLQTLNCAIMEEFPSVQSLPHILLDRHYERLDMWNI